MVLVAASSEAAPAVRQVLLLQSFDRGSLVNDYFTGNFHVDLDQRSGQPVNVVQVVVSQSRLVGAPEQAIVDYIRSIFADRPGPDLIMTVAGPATVFARKYRQQLFPEVPLLFAAVDRRYLGSAPLGENETAVAVGGDFPGLVDQILQLLPGTHQVFIVMGSGPLAAFWHQELETLFARFRNRLTFIWSEDLSLAEILRRCASLPSHSAILYLAFGTDAQGGLYADERVLADLHAAANAPLFSPHSVLLGAGIVGGSLVSIDDLSRSAADAAIRILDGAPPGNVKIPPQPPGAPTFDWRELQRWGIPESRLPPGSVVRYRAPSLWRAYRGAVLSAAGVLAVQSLLIAGLLYQRRARQRAEIDSRRNLALAADASRRQTMSALTSSIAHELSQPLNSMMLNAQALQMMVTTNRATADTIGEVLSDIETQGVRATQIIDRHRMMLRSHQLDKKPIDIHAVINESVALVAHDMKAHQIVVAAELPPAPCVISGDPCCCSRCW
jgi:signal transduction histidine kinase